MPLFDLVCIVRIEPAVFAAEFRALFVWSSRFSVSPHFFLFGVHASACLLIWGFEGKPRETPGKSGIVFGVQPCMVPLVS